MHFKFSYFQPLKGPHYHTTTNVVSTPNLPQDGLSESERKCKQYKKKFPQSQGNGLP